MARRIVLALGMLVVLAAPALAQVKIGLSVPLTGPDAAYGQGMKLGAEQAVADLNRAAGPRGTKLQLLVEDDASEGKQAIAVATKLASLGVLAVVGPLNSGLAAATQPTYDDAGIVMMLPSAPWPALTARGAWNVFRLSGSDVRQATIAGNWLASNYRNKPIAIVHDKSSFGRMLADGAARVVKANGGGEASFDSVTRGEKDFVQLASRLKAARIEAVYFGGGAAEAAYLIRAMREAGLTAPLVGSDALLDKDFAQIAGAGAEGTVMTIPSGPSRLPQRKGARLPTTPEAESVAAGAYAAIEVLKQAIDATKGGDGRALAAQLHEGKPLATLIGEVAFDAKGDLEGSPYVIETWRRTTDGRLDYVVGAER